MEQQYFPLISLIIDLNQRFQRNLREIVFHLLHKLE